MKKKTRKLNIRRETLRQLSDVPMQDVAGGAFFRPTLCCPNPTISEPGCGPSCELEVC